MKGIHVRLTQSLMDQVDAEAAKAHISRSEVIRSALRCVCGHDLPGVHYPDTGPTSFICRDTQ